MANLLDYDRKSLEAYFQEIGDKPYRASQVIKWVHQVGVHDYALMTNLSKSLRSQLERDLPIKTPEVVMEQLSNDGTCKWILKLEDGNCIETVYIPEDDRGTLCVSSQVGCALNCQFCSTATQGFSRNLSTGEIIGQVWVAVRGLSKQDGVHDRKVTNVVMMGMGEPLLNFDAVVAAMDLMMDDFAYGLSKRRVTLSTSGVLPALRELRKVSGVALAVSLHAPNDELRSRLVPLNKKYPIAELMDVCRNYFADEPRRKVTFEYVMLQEVNDKPEHAKQLIKILEGVPAKVNLIPFNPFPHSGFERSSKARIDKFRDILIRAGINTITRKTRGDDIDAACGQLVGKVQDRTRRSQRIRDKIQSIPVQLLSPKTVDKAQNAAE